MPLDVLSVQQTAARLGVSPRRVHALITSGDLAAEKIAGAYWIHSADVENAVLTRRPRGRPRKRDAADMPFDVARAVQDARTEDDMIYILHTLASHIAERKVAGSLPGMPSVQEAIKVIDPFIRGLDTTRRAQWRLIIDRVVHALEARRLSAHLEDEYGVIARMYPDDASTWCVHLYRHDGSGPTTTIRSAEIHATPPQPMDDFGESERRGRRWQNERLPLGYYHVMTTHTRSPNLYITTTFMEEEQRAVTIVGHECTPRGEAFLRGAVDIIRAPIELDGFNDGALRAYHRSIVALVLQDASTPPVES